MAELKLKILLEAMDRVSGPFRRVKESTDQMKAAMKGAAATVLGLEKAQKKAAEGITAFGRLKVDAKANAAALAEAQQKAQAMGRAMGATAEKTKAAQAAFDAATREVKQLKGDMFAGTTALAAAEEKVKALGEAAKQTAAEEKTMRAAFATARAEVKKLGDAEITLRQDTIAMRRQLAGAGIDTKNLAAGQHKLKADLDAARIAATKQAAALDALRAKSEAMAKARGRMEATQRLQGKLAGQGAGAMVTGGSVLMAGTPVISAAGDFQHNLAAYGLTADQTGEQLQAVRDKLRGLSVDVNQSAADLLEGQSILVGKGLDPDKALSAIGTIGRAVTATGAEMADMSNLAFSVMDNLKVPQAELAAAFNIMAKSGDLGGFELKDMAATFPQLTAAAHMLGMTGTKAIGTMSAALQIATKGAADPQEAANNFANFLQKASSPETVKNFAKKGIDIKSALTQGLLDGEDPIDVMMKLIGKAVGVDLEKEMSEAVKSGLDKTAAAEQLGAKFNLGELFGDMQVLNFLSPMMANMKEFRRVRDESMNSDGAVDHKFDTMAKTFNETTKGLGIDLKNTMEAVGNAMLPVLTPLARGLRVVMQGMNSFAASNPRLTATLVTVVGGLALVVAACGAVALAIGGMLGPFAIARFGLAAIGIQGGFAAGGLALLRGGFGLVAGAAGTLFPMLIGGIRAVGMAFMMNPIGLAIAAIAAAAALIYVYWEPIKAFFSGLWDAIGADFAGGLVAMMNPITAIGAAAALIYVQWEPVKAFFADLWDGIASSFSAAWAVVTAGIEAIKSPLAAIAGVFDKVFGDSGRAAVAAGMQTVRATAPIKIASTAAMAAAVAAPLAATAPAAAAAPAPMGGITIVVNAAPGQSEAEIAKLVRLELEKWQARQRTDARSRLYDGDK